MNRIHRIVFNRAKGVCQAVSEVASAARPGADGSASVVASMPARSALASACLLALAAMAALGAASARADGGTGGSGYLGNGSRGAGGTAAQPAGSAGGTASYDSFTLGAGGGGGAMLANGDGAAGGNGGGPAPVAAGGAGGTTTRRIASGNTTITAATTGGNGTAGGPATTAVSGFVDGGGGGGGGAGAGIASSSTGSLTIGNAVAGGRGGDGGAAAAADGWGGGGGGGQGGIGVLLTGATGAVTVNAGASVRGGNGGNGGAASQGSGGNGGDGGTGIQFSGVRTLTNRGTIAGGNGGAAGASTQGGTAGTAGAGGAAIVAGGGATVLNIGTITAGNSGAGVAGDAIRFNGGGANTLSLEGTSVITGNVVATAGGTDRLVLGGTAAGSFDASAIGAGAQYRNFASFVKSGSSTWTLSGTTADVTPWSITADTLSIASDASLGNAAGALALSGGGTLLTTASTDSTRSVSIGTGGGSFNAAAGTTLTLGGTVSGAGRLTKLGTGTLVLTGTDTYTGGTTISAGTLQLGNGGTGGSITGNVTDNGVLAFNRSNALTVAGVISGTGSVRQVGSGTTTLSGANTYSGGTTVTAGTLSVSTNANLGNNAGGLTLDGGTLQTTGSFSASRTVSLGSGHGTIDTTTGAVTLSGVVSGDGALTKTGAGTLTLSNAANTYVGSTAITGGTLAVSRDSNLGNVNGGVWLDNNAALQATGTFTTNRTMSIGNGGGTFNTNSGTTLTLGGTVQGGALRKTGAGTLVLAGAKTYAGGTTVSAGTLSVAADASLGASTGALTLDGGTLLETASFASSRAVTLGAGNGSFNTATGTTLTLDGTVSGPGGLAKLGAGTLVLNGNNDYAGGTTFSAGTVTIGSDANLGRATGGLAFNGGTLLTSGTIVANRAVTLTGTAGGINTGAGSSLTLAGTVSGTGRLNKLGAGTLVIAGSNSHTGGTNVSAGTVSIASDAALGGAAGTLTLSGGSTLKTTGTTSGTRAVSLGSGGGNFDTAPGTSLTLGGTVSGSGRLTKLGAGTLVLAGTDTYTGGTTISAGTLQLGNGGTSGSITGNVTDNGVLAFNRSNALTVAGVISGTGGVRQVGSGTTTLSGANTYSGGTTVTAGTLSVSTNANLGNNAGGLTLDGGALQATATFATSRPVTLGAAGGTLSIDSGVTLTESGTVSGTGALGKIGAGTLVLTGAGNYQGGTTISAGTLQLGSGGTTGSIAGDVVNEGTLAFNRSDALSFAGKVSGWGMLSKRGSNTLTLTGDNSYGGGIDIAAGTLQVGNGGTSGSLAGNVTNAGTLAFDRADEITFAGMVSGAGRVVQAGTGTTVLTGDSAYGGGTTISAGTLQLGNGGTSGSITGDVANGGTLAFDRSDNLAFAGAITGTGGVKQIGAGTTTLSGTSSYGGATTVSAGTLQVDGVLANSAVGVGNGGTLAGRGTIVAAVTVADGGTLQGSSGQTLQTGALSLASGSTVHAVLGTPGSTALFQVNGALTLDGQVVVSDLGGYGAGVYRLMNYTGTLVDNGLQVGSQPAGSAVTVQTAIANQVNLVNTAGQTLAFWDGGSVSNLNNNRVDGGTGTWTAMGGNWADASGALDAPMTPRPGFAVFQGSAGTVTVDNTQGAVAVNGMQFATDGYVLQGAAVELAAAQSIVRVGDGSATPLTATIASALTGAAQLEKTDQGRLVLTGTNSYGGGTRISGGTLQIGNGGTSGSITGDVIDNGTLAFNRSDAVTFAGAISGSGTVEQMGSGTTTLTGSNTYSGGTVISAGTLAGTAGSLGTGPIANNGRLELTQTATASMANAMSGSGIFVKRGAGALDLVGNSTAFTGSTQVAEGTLAVNGTLGGSLTMAGGTTLKGNGTVGNTVVQSGATVAPGNSIGTLHVAGNLTLAAGSTYQVEAQGSGQADKIQASGSVTLQGGALSVLASGNWNPISTYTILEAGGGVSGSFGAVTTNMAFLDPTLSYDGQGVALRLQRNDVSFESVAGTPNQQAVAEAVKAGDPLYDAIVQLDAATSRVAFDQLSGEVHASLKTAAIEDSRFVRDAGLDRVRQALGAVAAPTDVAASRGVWARAFGSRADFDGDGNAAQVDRSISGLFIGADTVVADDWRVGALAGYSHSDVKLDTPASSGTTDAYHLGVYGGRQWGALGLRAGAAWTDGSVDTQRTVDVAGMAGQPTASYHAQTAQAFGELGWRIDAGAAALEPFAGLAHVNLRTDGFTESGGTAALGADSSTSNTTFSTLGLRAATQVDAGGMPLKLRGMVGWRHAFGDVSPTAALAFAGQPAFTVAGVPLAKDVAVIEAGVGLALARDLNLGVSYSGQVGNGVKDHGLRATLAWKF